MHLFPTKGSIVNLIAGILVLGSVLLGLFVNTNWLYLSAFIGFMLIISSLTGICLISFLFKAFGVKEEQCCKNA
ncbi:YgaP-like transmembrane domain [Calidifontibacillus erzurumensis]|uniref:DUF2892 domain-containing protein n=1 Tax=Calidifontibacillus erzurumensis TaxID=2741433 RepID=A0A8J8GF07_9BACI|nr:YgaP-like transmembrane domain [Calidifontibacillus erzurumensis]NSL52699.1 DUF2892 domain-containing protein [Calidifontibacillus erzurumensis]